MNKLVSFLCLSLLLASIEACKKNEAGGNETPTVSGTIKINEYNINHSSIVPNFVGQNFSLYLKEKVKDSTLLQNTLASKVVLMIHGTTISGNVIFDLNAPNYSWMEYLAKRGFDVFCLDLTGYGKSTRPLPMNNIANLNSADKSALGLPASTVVYPFTMTTLPSEIDDINTAVDYIKSLRNVNKITLVGGSLGASRVCKYAATYSNKVDKLVLMSMGSQPSASPTPTQIPANGNPITITTKQSFISDWDAMVQSSIQVENGMQDLIWNEIKKTDSLGSTWGTGCSRSPKIQSYGLTAGDINGLTQPVLIFNGQYDNLAIPFFGQLLYAQFSSAAAKIQLTVNNTSHLIPFEKNSQFVYKASADFLLNTQVNSRVNTKGTIDINGNYIW